MNESDARCPRCGGEFHCGAADPSVPCACKAIALDVPTLAALRERYASCLCMACLREIQRGALSDGAPSA
jgi:Cysteine-rich CWC